MRGFGIAVHHHHGLGNGPRLAEPMVLIGHPHSGPNFQLAHLVAALLRHFPILLEVSILLRKIVSEKSVTVSGSCAQVQFNGGKQ
ncbi:MAG: hypothetical protein WAN75_44515 [Xanthobacteraceae bacterium]